MDFDLSFSLELQGIPCTITSFVYDSSADPEGGGETGGQNPPPPLRFVGGGVFCRGLIGRRGGPTVVLTLLLSFFFRLASLASIIQTYYLYIHLYVLQAQCSVWNGHPFSIVPLSKL